MSFTCVSLINFFLLARTKNAKLAICEYAFEYQLVWNEAKTKKM